MCTSDYLVSCISHGIRERCLWLRRIGIASAAVRPGEKMEKWRIFAIETVISHHPHRQSTLCQTQLFAVSQIWHTLVPWHMPFSLPATLTPNSLLQTLYFSFRFWLKHPPSGILSYLPHARVCSLLRVPIAHNEVVYQNITHYLPPLLVYVLFATASWAISTSPSS